MHSSSLLQRFALFTGCLALPGLGLALDAHQASGWFSVDGEKVQVVAAYGWQEPHLFDRSKKETVVMLATVPFDHAALDRQLSVRFEPAAMVRRAGGESITLTIEPDGRIFSAMPSRIERASGGGPRVPAELVPHDGGLVGKAATTEPMQVTELGSMDGETPSKDRMITFDVHFNISLVERKPSGSPLPADGGEPGAVFMKLHAARQADDMEAAMAFLTPSKAEDLREQLADPEMTQMIAYMREMGPKTARIVSGLSKDSDAYLEVGGEMGNGSTYAGTVRLERLTDGWRIAEEVLRMGE